MNAGDLKDLFEGGINMAVPPPLGITPNFVNINN